MSRSESNLIFSGEMTMTQLTELHNGNETMKGFLERKSKIIKDMESTILEKQIKIQLFGERFKEIENSIYNESIPKKLNHFSRFIKKQNKYEDLLAELDEEKARIIQKEAKMNQDLICIQNKISEMTKELVSIPQSIKSYEEPIETLANEKIQVISSISNLENVSFKVSNLERILISHDSLFLRLKNALMGTNEKIMELKEKIINDNRAFTERCERIKATMESLTKENSTYKTLTSVLQNELANHKSDIQLKKKALLINEELEKEVKSQEQEICLEIDSKLLQHDQVMAEMEAHRKVHISHISELEKDTTVSFNELATIIYEKQSVNESIQSQKKVTESSNNLISNLSEEIIQIEKSLHGLITQQDMYSVSQKHVDDLIKAEDISQQSFSSEMKIMTDELDFLLKKKVSLLQEVSKTITNELDPVEVVEFCLPKFKSKYSPRIKKEKAKIAEIFGMCQEINREIYEKDEEIKMIKHKLDIIETEKSSYYQSYTFFENDQYQNTQNIISNHQDLMSKLHFLISKTKSAIYEKRSKLMKRQYYFNSVMNEYHLKCFQDSIYLFVNKFADLSPQKSNHIENIISYFLIIQQRIKNTKNQLMENETVTNIALLKNWSKFLSDCIYMRIK